MLKKLYAVYHESMKPTHGACTLYDGLLLVSAGSKNEACHVVRKQMGSSYNDCFVQEVKNENFGVILEFWRTPPRRPPARHKHYLHPLEELAA